VAGVARKPVIHNFSHRIAPRGYHFRGFTKMVPTGEAICIKAF
jgi:hypothetical protein